MLKLASSLQICETIMGKVDLSFCMALRYQMSVEQRYYMELLAQYENYRKYIQSYQYIVFHCCHFRFDFCFFYFMTNHLFFCVVLLE